MITLICTRSRSTELYAMASEFWPEGVHRDRKWHLDQWVDAARYLEWCAKHLLADVVINCDEDCFVFDWGVVEQLVRDMEEHGYAYAGMPDTKDECRHRSSPSFVHNPFFTVFRPRLTRKALREAEQAGHVLIPYTDPSACPWREPYESFYMALYQHAQGLPLKGTDHTDGTSTVLSYQGKPFALHSWYARGFETTHRERILNLYHEARHRCTLS